MSRKATIRRLDGSELASYRHLLVELYREVYAEPPYLEGEDQVADYVNRFEEESARPGFALVIAEHDSDLAGYAYGHSFHAGEWWQDAEQQPAETQGRTKFAIIELAVRKPYRERGIGTALMRDLLTRRPEDLATLCSNPAAPARRIYHRWGWRHVAHAHPTGMPPLDVLVYPLQTGQ